MVLIKPLPPAIVAIESTAAAIDAGRPRWVRVSMMRGGIHEKAGRPPSFRLRFATEEGWVSEFLALEHEKPGARWYAGRAWARLSRAPTTPPPTSARDAYRRFIGGELHAPQRLRIERDGQWWRVVEVAPWLRNSQKCSRHQQKSEARRLREITLAPGGAA
jgi:hypothetical protein